MKTETVTVGSVVSRPAVLVDADATLREAAEVLDRETIGVAIIRGTGSTSLVSERDIVRALAEGANPDRERVGNVATLDVEVIASHESIEAAARMMLADEIRHLPVLHGEQVVGVVSIRDILEAVITSPGEPGL